MTLEQKLNGGTQYRDFLLEPQDDMVVEGYATTFNEPYLLWRDGNYEVWEQVDSKAFENTDLSDVVMQYNHEGRVFARNSNGTLTLRADEHGLHVTALLGGTEIGRQLYEEIKGGYTNKMSFGFTVEEDKREIVEEGDNVRVMRTILNIGKLYDVSAVSIPANDGTAISARTYGVECINEIAEEFRKRDERKAQIERIKALTEVNYGTENC
jgi:HK97 family phage prohead protease